MTETFKFEAKNISRVFGHGKKAVTAVDNVTFKIRDREIISLVGQSGCGKTVLAKMLLRLETPTAGELNFNGKPIAATGDPRNHWRQVQAVFQDPFSCFNQFFTIRSQLKASFRLFEKKPSPQEIEERVDQARAGVVVRGEAGDGLVLEFLFAQRSDRDLLARFADRRQAHDALQCPSASGG